MPWHRAWRGVKETERGTSTQPGKEEECEGEKGAEQPMSLDFGIDWTWAEHSLGATYSPDDGGGEGFAIGAGKVGILGTIRLKTSERFGWE